MEHTGAAATRDNFHSLGAVGGGQDDDLSRGAEGDRGPGIVGLADHARAARRRGRRNRLPFRERGGIQTAARRPANSPNGRGCSRRRYGTPRAPLDAAIAVGPRHPARHRHPGRAPDSREVSAAMRSRFSSCRRASTSSEERLRGRATENEAAIAAAAAARARGSAGLSRVRLPDHQRRDSRIRLAQLEGDRKRRAAEGRAACARNSRRGRASRKASSLLPTELAELIAAGAGVQPASRHRD